MPDADMYKVIQAGLYGAKEGEYIGKQIARDVAGPSVVKRMEMAIDIGLGTGTSKEKMVEIGHRIGAGLHVAEAIPSAFGIFAAYNGDAMGSIIGAVNVGYDTDTVATMSGALCRSFKWSGFISSTFLPTLEKANNLEIEKLAKDLTKLAKSALKQERRTNNE